MIVISKNGIKLNIQPRRWWDIEAWIWAFEQANIIKNQDIYINTEGWKFTHGNISEDKP